MSIALREPPDLDRDAGGIVARRAVIRWGWRLFRREWRQQLLVLGLLTVAVAAAIWGTSVVTNSQLPNATYATLGTAAASAALPGADPHLAADIAAIQGRWGPADLIESQDITAGTAQPLQLRAESPHGHYNAPLLGLVSGSYPAGPGQVALTSGVAAQYGAHVGGTWQPAGRVSWRVTGIVQNPSNLADQFALVAPGQITHPSQVTLLLGPAAAQATGPSGTLPGVPAATVTNANGLTGGLSPAVPILLVELLGLAFIGLLSVASFSVLAQRRLRALGMLERDRRDRTQPPPGHDRERPGRRRDRRAGRGGARPRRLDRVRADAAAGHRPRGGRGAPAVVGVRHRDRARDRDLRAGGPPPG